ncbi:MAG: Fe-S cluster assembly protein SufD [Candidatus Kapabacteria bacterium]|nr:Fe-S cluster assembly protein SufD [Candidatus Kapabacteria bacterium]
MNFAQKIEKEFNLIIGSSGDPEARSVAMSIFKKIGLPGKKIEEWKYTNINFLNDFEFDDNEKINKVLFSEIEHLIISKDFYRMVFVNGQFDKSLSFLDNMDEHIKLYQASQRTFHNYNHYPNGFIALNESLFSEGSFIDIPDNTILDKPLQILYIIKNSENSVFTNYKNQVSIGKHSKIDVIETVRTIGNGSTFTTIASNFKLGESSTLNYYNFQSDSSKANYYGYRSIDQSAKSNFNDFTISIASNFIRNDVFVNLLGEHCETSLSGFYYTLNDEFFDNHSLIKHAKPICTSNETYHGILDGASTAVFNGKIIVEPDAQKTQAYQSNRNILLSDTANIFTKPQLEIYADDVKCSHGATMGSLEKEHLFYLCSRGITEKMAKSMLLMAFANRITDKINIEPLRSNIEKWLSEKLEIE